MLVYSFFFFFFFLIFKIILSEAVCILNDLTSQNIFTLENKCSFLFLPRSNQIKNFKFYKSVEFPEFSFSKKDTFCSKTKAAKNQFVFLHHLYDGIFSSLSLFFFTRFLISSFSGFKILNSGCSSSKYSFPLHVSDSSNCNFLSLCYLKSSVIQCRAISFFSDCIKRFAGLHTFSSPPFFKAYFLPSHFPFVSSTCAIKRMNAFANCKNLERAEGNFQKNNRFDTNNENMLKFDKNEISEIMKLFTIKIVYDSRNANITFVANILRFLDYPTDLIKLFTLDEYINNYKNISYLNYDNKNLLVNKNEPDSIKMKSFVDINIKHNEILTSNSNVDNQNQKEEKLKNFIDSNIENFYENQKEEKKSEKAFLDFLKKQKLIGQVAHAIFSNGIIMKNIHLNASNILYAYQYMRSYLLTCIALVDNFQKDNILHCSSSYSSLLTNEKKQKFYTFLSKYFSDKINCMLSSLTSPFLKDNKEDSSSNIAFFRSFFLPLSAIFNFDSLLYKKQNFENKANEEKCKKSNKINEQDISLVYNQLFKHGYSVIDFFITPEESLSLHTHLNSVYEKELQKKQTGQWESDYTLHNLQNSSFFQDLLQKLDAFTQKFVKKFCDEKEIEAEVVRDNNFQLLSPKNSALDISLFNVTSNFKDKKLSNASSFSSAFHFPFFFSSLKQKEEKKEHVDLNILLFPNLNWHPPNKGCSKIIFHKEKTDDASEIYIHPIAGRCIIFTSNILKIQIEEMYGRTYGILIPYKIKTKANSFLFDSSCIISSNKENNETNSLIEQNAFYNFIRFLKVKDSFFASLAQKKNDTGLINTGMKTSDTLLEKEKQFEEINRIKKYKENETNNDKIYTILKNKNNINNSYMNKLCCKPFNNVYNSNSFNTLGFYEYSRKTKNNKSKLFFSCYNLFPSYSLFRNVFFKSLPKFQNSFLSLNFQKNSKAKILCLSAKEDDLDDISFESIMKGIEDEESHKKLVELYEEEKKDFEKKEIEKQIMDHNITEIDEKYNFLNKTLLMEKKKEKENKQLEDERNLKKLEDMIYEGGLDAILKLVNKNKNEKNKTENFEDVLSKNATNVNNTSAALHVQQLIAQYFQDSGLVENINSDILPNNQTYYWKETLTNIQIWCPTPYGIGGRDIKVKFLSDSLCVQIRNKKNAIFEPFLKGNFVGRIIPYESHWLFDVSDPKCQLHLILLKAKKQNYIWKKMFL